MEITFLGVVFAVIIVLLAIGRPLYQAIAGGMIVTAGLFHIPVTVIVTKIASVIQQEQLFSLDFCHLRLP